MRRSLSSNIALGHTTIDRKVMSIDKARLIARQEQNSLRLLNSLTKPPHREMNLTSVTLLLIITEPVLQERCVKRRRAEVVEPEALAGVHHGEFTGEREDSALAGGVGELGRGGADEGDDGGGVDDGGLCLLVAAQRQDGVLAAEPDALDVDVLGQVPDVLGGVDGVVVLGVHDAGVVEEDVNAAPGVEGLDHGLDF